MAQSNIKFKVGDLVLYERADGSEPKSEICRRLHHKVVKIVNVGCAPPEYEIKSLDSDETAFVLSNNVHLAVEKKLEEFLEMLG